MDKLLLALDTSTRTASMALHDGVNVRIELTWETIENHTTELAPQLAAALAQLQAAPADLVGVAVAIGPGSFTGVRAGVAAAKGICLGRGLPIYGVRTLDIVAQAQAPIGHCPLVVVAQAGRSRWCAARYEWQNSAWQIVGDVWLTDAQTLGHDWERITIVGGEMTAGERHTLQARLGKYAQFISPAACLRRAGFLAEIGWARLRQGQADDLDQLGPIYVPTAGAPT